MADGANLLLQPKTSAFGPTLEESINIHEILNKKHFSKLEWLTPQDPYYFADCTLKVLIDFCPV
jgi:hypothetical protein